MYDIRLVTLLKLVVLKNYTKTAKELNFTQPTVTQHIKSLEKEYNIKIFKKDLSLTNAGKMLWEYAKQVNYNHTLFLTNINNLLQLEKKINIGLSEDIYYSLEETGFFYNLIRTSSNRIAICIMSETDLNQALMSAKIDFGFTNVKTDNYNLTVDEIYQDELVLAVKKGHLLVKKENASLKKYYLATLAPNDNYYNSLEQYFINNKLTEENFKNVIETNNFDLRLNMVLNHNSIGVFYKNNIASLLKKGELLILKETSIDIPIYLIRNKINYDMNKLAILNNLLDEIRE